LLFAAAPALGREALATLRVSITVANACTITIGGLQAESRCTYSQAATMRTVRPPAEPAYVGTGQGQGTSYVLVEY
jgi:hypothetical protein